MAKVKKRKGSTKARELMNVINAEVGDGTMLLGNDSHFEITRVPSGSLTIDRLTGGGFARGRHVELYGDESACKSYILYRTLALSQSRGNVCGLIDPENVFDSEWFAHLGGEPGSLITQRPETAEEIMKTMVMMFRSGDVEVVGIDSVAALLPRELREIDPTSGKDDRIASQARFMSKALRYLTTLNENTLVLWTNQLRTDVGKSYGNPDVTPGGKSLKFYDTTRIELKRGELVKKSTKVVKKSKLQDGDVIAGHWVKCKSTKEKSAYPGREGSFYFDGPKGEIDRASEVIQLGLLDGLITRSGNTFSFTDIDGTVWSGMETKFKRLIDNESQLQDELVEAIEDNTLRMARSRHGDSEKL